MSEEKGIKINRLIFPLVLSLSVNRQSEVSGEQQKEIDNIDKKEDMLLIDVPRDAYVIYLQSLKKDNNVNELSLLKKYSERTPFSDEEYRELIGYVMTTDERNWDRTGFLSAYGIEMKSDSDGKPYFDIIEDAKPSIKAETWECIIIDHLKSKVKDILELFDFSLLTGTETKMPQISLGAWKFTEDIVEQKLSDTIRTALFFTLVGYYTKWETEQYDSFSEYFDMEFFKRVSLINHIWNTIENKALIKYVSLYDSWYNLEGVEKESLINILKAILDNEDAAIIDKEELKEFLITNTTKSHKTFTGEDLILKQELIKPVFNYILLREKSKEARTSAKILFDNGKYNDCANRCYYAALYALESLLERKGKLADWRFNKLKEVETHGSLLKLLDELVETGELSDVDRNNYRFIKNRRWICDYQLYNFKKDKAEQCLKATDDFCLKIETLTK